MSFDQPKFTLVPKEEGTMGTPDAVREEKIVEASPEAEIIARFERLVQELQQHKGLVDEDTFQKAVDDHIAAHQQVIDEHLRSLPRKGAKEQDDALAA